MKNLTIIYPAVFGEELYSPWKEEYEIAKELEINVALFDEDTLEIKEDLKD